MNTCPELAGEFDGDAGMDAKLYYLPGLMYI